MSGDAQDGFGKKGGFADERIIGGAANPGLEQDLCEVEAPLGADFTKFVSRQVHTELC